MPRQGGRTLGSGRCRSARFVNVTFQPDNVAAAVFDIGGVFTYPSPDPVLNRLSELGLDTPPEREVFRRAHHVGVRALLDHATGGAAVDETSGDYWSVYDRAYLSAADVPESAAEEVRVAMRVRWDWAHDDNIASFHRLAASGLPVAIVSNNDGTAPEQMRRHGVCQVGDGPLPSVAAIVDSTLVGVAKPDPAIFAPALEALSLPPERVLYVGDTVQADVHGATAAGMQVVQLDPFDDHADHSHSRVAAVADVLAALQR